MWQDEVYKVTEKWSARRWTYGNSATRTFQVSGVPAGADPASGDAAAINALRRLVPDVKPGDAFRQDRKLKIDRAGPYSVGGPLSLREVVVNYTRPGGDASIEEANEWELLPEYELSSEDVEQDGTGKPIVNSAQAPFDPPLTMPEHSLSFRCARSESEFDAFFFLNYFNKWNSAATRMPWGYMPAGTVLIRSVKPSTDYRLSDPSVRVTYDFVVRPYIEASSGTYHGFHQRVLDKGIVGLVSGDDAAPIYYATGPNQGEQATEPVLLDGFGRPLNARYQVGPTGGTNQPSDPVAPIDETEDAVWLLYDLTRGPADFAGLNLSNNSGTIGLTVGGGTGGQFGGNLV